MNEIEEIEKHEIYTQKCFIGWKTLVLRASNVVPTKERGELCYRSFHSDL